MKKCTYLIQVSLFLMGIGLFTSAVANAKCEVISSSGSPEALAGGGRKTTVSLVAVFASAKEGVTCLGDPHYFRYLLCDPNYEKRQLGEIQITNEGPDWRGKKLILKGECRKGDVQVFVNGKFDKEIEFFPTEDWVLVQPVSEMK
jgi:hypothetical protein